MPNDERMTKPALSRRPIVDEFFLVRNSGVFRISTFVIRILQIVLLLICYFFHNSPSAAAQPFSPDYSSIDSIFTAHCLDCHASKDPEGQLVLESFEALMKG